MVARDELRTPGTESRAGVGGNVRWAFEPAHRLCGLRPMSRNITPPKGEWRKAGNIGVAIYSIQLCHNLSAVRPPRVREYMSILNAEPVRRCEEKKSRAIKPKIVVDSVRDSRVRVWPRALSDSLPKSMQVGVDAVGVLAHLAFARAAVSPGRLAATRSSSDHEG